MNRSQKLVLVIYAVLILCFTVFWVPQVLMWESSSEPGRYYRLGYYYAPIWMPLIADELDDTVVHIDFEGWVIEMFATSALLAIALSVLRKKQGGG